MQRVRLGIASWIAVTGLLLSACLDPTVGPSTDPFLRGTITSRAPRGIGVRDADSTFVRLVPQMLVVAPGGPSCGRQRDAAYFTLGEAISVRLASGGVGDTSALRVGAVVSVWQSGLILTSCPPLTAAEVVVVESAAPAAEVGRTHQ
jgi:hypothetical protein